jgi:hypothetical protein
VALELGDFGVDLLDLFLHPLALVAQEASGVGGQLTPLAQILVEIKGDQLVGDPLRRFRGAIVEGQGERDADVAFLATLRVDDVGADHLALDVAAHDVGDLGKRAGLALLGVQIVALDDLFTHGIDRDHLVLRLHGDENTVRY